MRTTLIAAALALATAPAFAAEGFSIRAGYANVNPTSDNGTVAGAAASIDSNSQPILGASYFFGNGLEAAFDGPISKFDHTVTLAGLGEVVDLGHRPVTLGLNWHFLANDTGFSPYAGLGYHWTALDNVRGINALAGAPVDVEDSNGLAANLGVDYNISETFYLRGEARYLDFDSKVTLGGADIGTATVDPWVFSLQAGIRF